jgi:hypothetical protein
MGITNNDPARCRLCFKINPAGKKMSGYEMEDRKSKYVILVGDGMADEAQKELDGKTPLEEAQTPHMDRLRQLGPTKSLEVMWQIWPFWVTTLIGFILGVLLWRLPVWE